MLHRPQVAGFLDAQADAGTAAEAEVARLETEAGWIPFEQARWEAFQRTIDPDRFPLTTLDRIYGLMPPTGVRFKQYEDSIEIEGGPLRGVDVDMEEMPDTVLTLADVASQAQGPTRITNIANLRAQQRCDVRAGSVMQLGAMTKPCDLVLLDPPYGSGAGAVALDRLRRLGWIGEATWIALETAHDEKVQVKGLEIDAERKVGRARITLLRPAVPA